MSNFFHQAVSRLRNSPFIVPIYLALLIGFIISIGIIIEDYSTSLLGYSMIPTQRANEWIVPLVAALPQVAQVIFLYVFLRDTSSYIYLIVAVLIHLVDAGTDIYFKSYGGTQHIAVAIVETEIIYTLGSEVLFTMTLGLLLESVGDFVTQLKAARKRLGSAVHTGGGGSTPPTPTRTPMPPQQSHFAPPSFPDQSRPPFRGEATPPVFPGNTQKHNKSGR